MSNAVYNHIRDEIHKITNGELTYHPDYLLGKISMAYCVDELSFFDFDFFTQEILKIKEIKRAGRKDVLERAIERFEQEPIDTWHGYSWGYLTALFFAGDIDASEHNKYMLKIKEIVDRKLCDMEGASQ